MSEWHEMSEAERLTHETGRVADALETIAGVALLAQSLAFIWLKFQTEGPFTSRADRDMAREIIARMNEWNSR